MVSWGIVSGLMVFVRSAEIFYLLRFILGMAEAGFFPGIILYLTYWFPSRRRGQMIALFMLAITFTGVIGGPISGLIMAAFRDSQGLKAWQMLFLLEAIPSIAIGFLVPLLLPNGLQSARWLSEREKVFLDQNVRTENRSKHHLTLRQVFAEPRIPLFCIVYFCSSAGLYGVAFWLPQIISDTGIANPLGVSSLSAMTQCCLEPPSQLILSVCGVLSMPIISRRSMTRKLSPSVRCGSDNDLPPACARGWDRERGGQRRTSANPRGSVTTGW